MQTFSPSRKPGAAQPQSTSKPASYVIMENVERQRKVVQLKTDPSFASKMQATTNDERILTEFSKLNSNSATELAVTVHDRQSLLDAKLDAGVLPIISEAPTGSQITTIEQPPLVSDSQHRDLPVGQTNSDLLQYSQESGYDHQHRALKPRAIEKDTIQSADQSPYRSTGKYKKRRNNAHSQHENFTLHGQESLGSEAYSDAIREQSHHY